ncbi:MAG: penicillin-binding protein 1C [Rhodothermales bacterium]
MNSLLNTWWKKAIAGAMLAPVVGLFVLNALFPLPLERLHPPTSTVVLDRDGALLRAFLAPDEMWRIHVEAGEISPALKRAVLSYEDRRFYWHPGIDPVSILRATWANLRAGRVEQGGSTITMQVARMMEPKPRTLANKLLEAFRAWQLEERYSKEEILTLYFNLAPYGGNIVGVGAASYFYFDKHPGQLSLGEAALLAAIPNNPNRNRPDLDAAAAEKVRGKILKLLADHGEIDAVALEEALSEPVPTRRYDLPFQAPHLAVHLAQQHVDAGRLATTIDFRLQERVEQMLKNHLQPLLGQGITNGAVVVIDNKSQDVLALVGSRWFFDEANEGQVNGAMAPRSPGSALKPFIYALALDRGLISPKMLLYDVPVDFSGYQPENYDRTYNGMVPAEEALIRSLNVPAVNLASRLHGDGIYQFMKRAHVTTLTEPDYHYGLSLILGGCEVTLLELTNLYAGLANGGRFRPYRLLQTDPLREGEPLLNPGAAFIVGDILSQLRRPDLPAVWEWSRDMPKVAWKTGTSYGHRDAWSVGFTPRYTVGVWLGNMDGKGAPALVGAEVAAPLLFALFNHLEANTGQQWYRRPSEVETRRICSVSGGIATPLCPTSREENYLPGHSPMKPCTLHQIVLVDRETGHRLCSHCKLGRDYHEKVVAHWPAEIAVWLERNGYPLDEIPEHLPGCSRLADGDPPVIRSPQPDTEYRMRAGVPAEFQKILLEASVSNQTQTIYWFADGEMIYSGDPTERVFLTPSPGKHTLLCLDDEGRSSEVYITIR